MKTADIPLSKEVVLVGGGHAHALLLRRWAMRPVEGARLTLINPAPTAPYTGMLPGHVAGHYPREALEIDLVRLARLAGARLVLGHATGIDRVQRRITVDGRPGIAYDIASIDVGITSDMPSLPGFAEYGIAAKPLGPFAERWRSYLDADTPPGPIVVIGAGVGGVELALAMKHALAVRGRDAKVQLIDKGEALSGISGHARSKVLRVLDEHGIGLREQTGVARIARDHVELEDGAMLPSGFTVGAAGAQPLPWLGKTGLDLTEGFVTVGPDLRSVSDPSIYAVGDCAHLSHAPRPKAGVFAVRAAPVLTHNIAADLMGTSRRVFRPQGRYLKLISLGGKTAIADKWSIAPMGAWAWRLKDGIDRKFMDRLNAVPKDATPRLPARRVRGGPAAPLCGGCGAKVGPDTLSEALARLPAMPRSDVATAVGDDAAVLAFGDQRQVISTDHLRAFWPDPFVMARIAALHALGDVWSMGARPQAMLAQITLPRMEPGLQSAWLEDILSAAGEVAKEAGAALVGGHTTMGAELTIGFTVTGLVDGTAHTLDLAQDGDHLLLTRPVGSGTLLAAEMTGRARGADVAGMIACLATSEGDVALALAAHSTAMTDVTGFGLAGHAARMASASGLTAELWPGAVPLFPGARDLAAAGVRSTIYPANRAAVPAEVPETAEAALLFDPQTAGGFLAAVPGAALEGALTAARAAGGDAAVIGRMTAWSGGPVDFR